MRRQALRVDEDEPAWSHEGVRAAALIALALMVASPVLRSQEAPSLVIEAPPELSPTRARLESYDLAPLADITRLIGLEAPGPPIRVVLATTDGDWARQVAPWVAGFALGDQDLVVLFPARSPGYPHDTLEDVLRHEVAHVLISRAAGGHDVPRWFHEGLAMSVERPWGLRDRSRLASELLLGRPLTLQGINGLFLGDEGSQSRAYSLGAAVVRDLISEYGASAPARVLRGVKGGQSFDLALAGVTQRSIAVFENDFWDRQQTWTTWIPLVASSSFLWLGVLGLAALAARRRRQRAAAIRQQWAAEEAAEAGVREAPDDSDPRGGVERIH